MEPKSRLQYNQMECVCISHMVSNIQNLRIAHKKYLIKEMSFSEVTEPQIMGLLRMKQSQQRRYLTHTFTKKVEKRMQTHMKLFEEKRALFLS